MIVGHAPLAFVSVVIVLFSFTNFSRQKIVYFGLVAGIASIIPDIDILFPLASIFLIDEFSLANIISQFWTVAEQQHRFATHSIIILGSSSCITIAQMLLPKRVQKYSVPFTLLAIFISPISLPIQLITSSTIITLYILRSHTQKLLSIRELGLAFTIGFIIHPIGDMFTGTPPTILYPFTDILELTRVSFGNPTVHFGAVFILEIGSLILAFLLLSYLTENDFITYNNVKPKPYHIMYAFSIIGCLLLYFNFKISPTVDSATTFVIPLVSLTIIGNIHSLSKQNIINYISSVSWTLLFAICIFLLFTLQL
jgi:hypothetical protein